MYYFTNLVNKMIFLKKFKISKWNPLRIYKIKIKLFKIIFFSINMSFQLKNILIAKNIILNDFILILYIIKWFYFDTLSFF